MRNEEIADRIVRDVAELPDRTSPEGAHEVMLVTSNELREIVMLALEDLTDDDCQDHPRLMTDAERTEIAEIERRKKVEFEAKLKELGPGYSAKHPRLS